MEIKTTKRYHVAPVRTLTVLKTITNAGENVEKGLHLHAAAGDGNWYSHCGKQYGTFLKKLIIDLH